MEWIYYSGVIIAFIIGNIELIFSDDDECSIDSLLCYLVMVGLSALSWLIVIMRIGIFIKEIIKDKK